MAASLGRYMTAWRDHLAKIDPDEWSNFGTLRGRQVGFMDRWGGRPFWWAFAWFNFGSFCTANGSGSTWSLWATRAFGAVALTTMFVAHQRRSGSRAA